MPSTVETQRRIIPVLCSRHRWTGCRCGRSWSRVLEHSTRLEFARRNAHLGDQTRSGLGFFHNPRLPELPATAPIVFQHTNDSAYWAYVRRSAIMLDNGSLVATSQHVFPSSSTFFFASSTWGLRGIGAPPSSSSPPSSSPSSSSSSPYASSLESG